MIKAVNAVLFAASRIAVAQPVFQFRQLRLDPAKRSLTPGHVSLASTPTKLTHLSKVTVVAWVDHKPSDLQLCTSLSLSALTQLAYLGWLATTSLIPSAALTVSLTVPS
jgi:hypothetical protein